MPDSSSDRSDSGTFQKPSSPYHDGSDEAKRLPFKSFESGFMRQCSSRGKSPKSAVQAFYPTGDFPCHNEKELSRIFEAKESTSFSSNCQILTNDKESNKVTGNFYAGQGFGFFGDLPRGPRGNRRSRDLSSFSTSSSSSSNPLVNRDKYNLPDFQIKYEQAKFFVIKSFTEEDIHRSIKYNVWSSTWTGNRKLDCAFRDAEAQLHDGVKCHVFLFFSVNGSGQFVGLAEMFGPVDFKKTMNFWQEDKWEGFFPVKWHIIKDLPSSLFKNIILENNDFKAVTASRDTQEVELHQGLKMLSIFKESVASTCILDDFAFYEEKEKSQKPYKKSGVCQEPKSQVELHHGEKMFSILKDTDDFAMNKEREKFRKPYRKSGVGQAPVNHSQVELRHGVKMLSNLKDYHEGACILDDFAFYEEKERSQEPYRRNIVRHHQDHVEPVKRMEMSIGYEKTAKERDAAFLAAVTGRLSIKSSHESVRRPMRRNLK